ncbi:putative amidoligase domain-containing protein [Paenibacillus puerhi]|uniref:putative amidoligase domain-containing protein n=1 Tax=Paenibacillus puerhi TaxID=2692622 RepID=UPI0013586899|nr:hypothetical protein [Paenibacillus puerhi]
MRAFLLHSNEPGLDELLSGLVIPHGVKLPEGRAEERRLIYWGAYHPDKGEAAALQPVKSILAALQPQRSAELLRLHGLNTAAEIEGGDGEGERWTHEYIVPVFHLKALTVFHRTGNGVFYGGDRLAGHPVRPREDRDYTEIGLEQPGYYATRALRLAIRSLYALGLDYGVVRVGVRTDATLSVRGVDPIPKLTPRLAELFAQAINLFGQRLAREFESGASREVMLGADPEFLLLNERGKVRFASQFVGREGPFGCDAIVLPSRRKVFPLAELRPAPSTDVRKLITHLHRTMQLAAKRITDAELTWVAGGMPVRGFPLGGHIHFSGIELDVQLLRVLDNYVALPLTLLEDMTTSARKPEYGFLGDFRRQRHGGFEYRVLPSWMVSPSVAKGVLALAKLAAEHYPLLKRRPLGEYETVKAYYQSDKARIRPLVPALWNDLEKLRGYEALESYLLPLRRMMLQMRSWSEKDDIRPKWKIAPFL